MPETPDHAPAPSEQADPANPHSEDLDIEGPNESAPGHEPTEHGDERAGTPPSESEQ